MQADNIKPILLSASLSREETNRLRAVNFPALDRDALRLDHPTRLARAKILRSSAAPERRGSVERRKGTMPNDAAYLVSRLPHEQMCCQVGRTGSMLDSYERDQPFLLAPQQ
jgi:hypothetical protein